MQNNMVLIPSSSGQGFKVVVMFNLGALIRLNPFFIRARFQRLEHQHRLNQFRRLNPFFIRARFQSAYHRSIEEYTKSLNPFFIRARFQRFEIKLYLSLEYKVLIPSSSGQGFKGLSYFHRFVPTKSLNPFFIRARFQRSACPPRLLPKFGLNPFFIRARFQSKIATEYLAAHNVLIPSSSGQGFKAAQQDA